VYQSLKPTPFVSTHAPKKHIYMIQQRIAVDFSIQTPLTTR
jgi:hypothetical protein